MHHVTVSRNAACTCLVRCQPACAAMAIRNSSAVTRRSINNRTAVAVVAQISEPSQPRPVQPKNRLSRKIASVL